MDVSGRIAADVANAGSVWDRQEGAAAAVTGVTAYVGLIVLLTDAMDYVQKVPDRLPL